MNTTITVNISPGRAFTLTIDEARSVHEELCRLFGRDADADAEPSQYPLVPDPLAPLAPDPLRGYVWTCRSRDMFDGSRVED